MRGGVSPNYTFPLPFPRSMSSNPRGQILAHYKEPLKSQRDVKGHSYVEHVTLGKFLTCLCLSILIFKVGLIIAATMVRVRWSEGAWLLLKAE